MEIIKNEIMIGDCMDLLAELPDKSINIAILDPPYGININNSGRLSKYNSGVSWDLEKPGKKYFEEIKRVSENQIIWGGNYFIEYLENTRGFIIWDKKQPENVSFSSCEFAWTSFDMSAKTFYYSMLNDNKEKRFHECQKPIALYRWILQKYAKPGQLILDTHSGSGSLACACHIEKFDFIAIEKDPHYHALSVKRLEELRSQGRLF